VIFPDVGVQKWCEKWDLEVETSRCVICGRTRVANVPYLSQRWAGLIATDCRCGNKADTFGVFHDRTGECSDLCDELSLRSEHREGD